MINKITQSTCNVFSILWEEKDKWYNSVDSNSIRKNKFITTVDYDDLEDFLFWLTMWMQTKKIVLIQVWDKYILSKIKEGLNKWIYKCKF